MLNAIPVNQILSYLILFVFTICILSPFFVVTYISMNSKYVNKIKSGEIPAFYRLQRNGDGTISIYRKELFGFWNVEWIDFGEYAYPCIEEYSEFIDVAKKQIKEAMSKYPKNLEEKSRLEILAKKQQNLPTLIN